MLLVIVGSSLWITDLIDLMTGISHMRLIHALTCGMIVFVMPFIVWKNLPFALAGWKTRKSS